jgi:hypothetical protein
MQSSEYQFIIIGRTTREMMNQAALKKETPHKIYAGFEYTEKNNDI